MRSIVFGGAGFIGTHLARRLVAEGQDVIIADLVKPSRPVPGVQHSICDVRKPIRIRYHKPFDRVYNLAAVHRTPGHLPHEYYETNVRGAINVTEWCADGASDRITFTSSIATYGPTEDRKTESSAPTPNSDYGRSKFMAEQVHTRWSDQDAGRQIVTVRPAVVFGPGENGNFTRLASALRRERFVYPGRRDVIKSCGYVGELVNSIRWMESLPRQDDELFNFCYPQKYTLEDICMAFNEVAGYRLPMSIPPRLIAGVLAGLRAVNPSDRGNFSAARVAKLTISTNIEPEKLTTLGYPWKTDIKTALSQWRAESKGNTFS